MPVGLNDTRLEISGIASQFAIQNARFAIHNKLMHSKIANHLKTTAIALYSNLVAVNRGCTNWTGRGGDISLLALYNRPGL